MPGLTVLQRAERLRNVAAMGGFSVTMAEAVRGVLDAELIDRRGTQLTLRQTLAQIRMGAPESRPE